MSPQISIFLQQGEDAKGKQAGRYTSPCHTGKSAEQLWQLLHHGVCYRKKNLSWPLSALSLPECEDSECDSPYAFPIKTAHAVHPSPATLTGPLWCLLSFRRTVRQNLKKKLSVSVRRKSTIPPGAEGDRSISPASKRQASCSSFSFQSLQENTGDTASSQAY